jgi:hypothetical protein
MLMLVVLGPLIARYTEPVALPGKNRPTGSTPAEGGTTLAEPTETVDNLDPAGQP